jgi:uncharacterized membrane-anchored protein YhcB (DUF1043 family)
MTTLVWVFLVMSLSIGIFIGHKYTKWRWKKKAEKARKSCAIQLQAQDVLIDQLKQQLAKYDTKRPNSL